MRWNMHLFFSSLVILVFLFPHETFADKTDSRVGVCQRRCGGATFPYPLGFSPGCPIALSCDANTSTPILPSIGADNSSSYHVVSFNSTISSFLVTLPPSCSRNVSEASTSLFGINYGLSSRTGLFLRGGCGGNASVCTVPAGVMSGMLRTAHCGDNRTTSVAGTDAAVACVSSAAPNGTAPGIFLRWEKAAENTKCKELLTSAVYMNTADGTTSLEFSVAELGWWLNGTCAGGREQCAANATCSDVQTPSGATGHRCSCVSGMDGDGFSAGDGCYIKGLVLGSGISKKLENSLQGAGGWGAGCVHGSPDGKTQGSTLPYGGVKMQDTSFDWIASWVTNAGSAYGGRAALQYIQDLPGGDY